MTIREDRADARRIVIDTKVAARAKSCLEIEVEKTAINARSNPSRLTIA